MMPEASLLMESEARLYDFELTRFLPRTGTHPRVKPEEDASLENSLGCTQLKLSH
jgi:hypothetical protein